MNVGQLIELPPPPDETLDRMEREIHEMLIYLRQQYERAAQPYIDQLTRLHDLRPRRYVIVPSTTGD
jgi:hypothetical protein